MSSTPNVSVREWTDVVRRARLGKTTKYIALVLATYADYRDGARIWPGLWRLVWDAEVDIKTVRKVLAELVQVGLIEQVRPPRGRGGAAEYRLILGPDLLEHVDVPSPARALVEIGHLAEKRRAAPNGYHPAAPNEPGDNSSLGTARRDPNGGSDEPIGYQYAPPNRAIGYRPSPLLGTAPSPPPSTDLTTTTTSHSDEELRTAVTHTREAGPPQDQDSSLPERCAHGLASRLRADGNPSCALCRREADRPSATVIQLRPRPEAS